MGKEPKQALTEDVGPLRRKRRVDDTHDTPVVHHVLGTQKRKRRKNIKHRPITGQKGSCSKAPQIEPVEQMIYQQKPPTTVDSAVQTETIEFRDMQTQIDELMSEYNDSMARATTPRPENIDAAAAVTPPQYDNYPSFNQDAWKELNMIWGPSPLMVRLHV